MMTQLNPPIPLKTPKGRAWAIALVDYGPQWDLQWITFVQDTGECWTFRNSQIRQEANYTFGLGEPTPISQPSIAAQKPSAETNGHNGTGLHAAINGIDTNGLAPRENVY